MPSITSNPTVVVNPDGAVSAVSSATTTGHGSTVASATATASAPFGSDSDSEDKGARWTTFQPVAGIVTAMRLKMTWTASGNASATAGDGTATATSSWGLEYTLNGGGAWTLIAADSASSLGSPSFTNNDSADIVLSAAQDISQVQVRDSMSAATSADAGEIEEASASADVTVTLSDIRLEVTTQAQQQPIMLW